MSITVPDGTFFTLPDTGGLPTSVGQLMSTWLAAMQTAFPGYNPAPGNPEYVQAQIFASWAAAVAQLCTAGSVELFSQFGQQLLNVQPEPGVPATAVLNVTAADTVGHTLPAYTEMTLTLGGVQVGFQTLSDLVIASGVSTGSTVVQALTVGVAFNGATNPAGLIQETDWVASVAVAAAASGGVDPEDPSEYVQRLAGVLQLLSPRPITAQDFATLALSFTPATGTDQQEVGRATAIDNGERNVALCVTDGSGNALNADTVAAVGAWLEGLRETGFVITVDSPTYSTVYVTVTVGAVPGYSASQVQANVQTAILNLLTPANFGIPQGGTSGWNNTTTIYASTLAATIQNTAGVAHITSGSLKFDTVSPPVNTGDLALTGTFPMPQTTTTSVPTSAITVTT